MVKCKDCDYWTDWHDRVFACISNVHSNRVRNSLELRPCKFRPSPNIQAVDPMYTDGEFECNDGRETETLTTDT